MVGAGGDEKRPAWIAAEADGSLTYRVMSMEKGQRGRRLVSSLRFKLLLIVAISLLFSLGLVIFTSLEQRRDARDSAYNDARQLSDIIAARQEQLLEGARLLLMTLSAIPDVRAADRDACAEIFGVISAQDSPYENISLVDREGNILASAVPLEGEINIADRPYFRQVIAEGGFVVAGYIVSRVSGDPILQFAYPVRGEADEVNGVLTTRIGLQWLGAVTAEEELPPDAVLTLSDASGTILASYPDREDLTGMTIPEAPVVQAILENPEGGSVSATGIDGIERIYEFAPLYVDAQGNAVSVSVGFSEDYIYAGADRTLARNLIILGAVSVLALVLAWVLGDFFVVRRVRGLVEATRRLGEGDLGARTRLPHGGGELGELATSFDLMADSLQAKGEERDRAEESLRGSEERLAGLIATAPVGITFVDTHGWVTFANAAAEEILGLEGSDVPGRLYNDPAWRITDLDGSPFPEEELPFNRVMATGEEVRGVEHAIEHADGTRVFLSINAAPLHDAAGKISGMVATLIDITERKRADLKVREDEARFRGLFDNMSSGVAVYEAKDGGKDFVFRDFNRAAEKIEGVKREDLLGRSVLEAFPGVRDFGLFAVFQRVWRTGDSERFPFALYEDERISGWRDNYVLKLPSGEIIAIYDDISERVEAEREILRKSAVRDAVNSVLREALASGTEEGVAETCLRVSLELTGSEFGFIGEVNEEGLFDTIAQSRMAWEACTLPHGEAVMLIKGMKIRGYWGKAALTGKTQIVNDPGSHPERVGAPEGHPPIRSFIGVPLRRGSGTMGMIALANKPGGYTRADAADMEDLAVALVEAIQRKRDEEEIRLLNADLERRVAERTAQLEATNRELESFSYSVSHDLRAPLRAVDGFSQALLEDYYGQLDEQGRAFLSRVRAAAQRMAGLIDDILALSRVTRGELRRENVDLTALARDIADELRSQDPGRAAEFVIAPGLAADGDPALLRLALFNLLDNAFKFTSGREGARIEFGAEQSGGRESFFVRDNGAGFDMEYAGKLFGVFQRLHTAEEFPGSGIGLATVQRIIRRHGGEVWGEGEQGKGATFHFTVPGNI